jgi:hypothetical protein
MTYRHFAIHPRHHRPPAVRGRRVLTPPWVGALVAAACLGFHVMLPGYALVVRVRVEVVPAAAPAGSGPVERRESLGATVLRVRLPLPAY